MATASMSPSPQRPASFAARLTVALLAFAALVPAAPAAATARLSADLVDHLAAGSQSIKLIVQGTRAEVDALAARYNLVVKRYLATGAVLTVTAGQLAAMRDDGSIDHLSGDVRIQSAGDFAAQSIGADQLWAGVDQIPALSGEGIGVAVIDSGIDQKHASLRKRVVKTVDFTGGDGGDLFGHGTHVAALIAGQIGETAETGEYRGIASGAYLINLRVLGADGSGEVSTVIEAIDWAVANRRAYRIGVINLSLGAPVLQPYRDDPLCDAVERAVRAGIIVVAAAGNYGRTADGKSVYGAITSPGNSPYVVTVGAMDTHGTPQRSDDTLAPYSSKGPTLYDLVIKPDLAAPGSRLVSAEAAGGYLSETYPERHVAGSGAHAYFQLSGTSMATAVVSGGVALLLEERPDLTPATAKMALQVTSSFVPEAGLLGAGAGSVNVLAAAGLLTGDSKSTATSIGGEAVYGSGFYFTVGASQIAGQSIVWGAHGQSIVWGAHGQSIVWGAHGQSIVWGAHGQSIVWGAHGQSIVWGAHGQSIVWGAHGQSIVWGAHGQSIVWGARGESIVWGAHGQSIVWGAADPTSDSIVWGTADLADSIVWGTADPSDSIVWGTADSSDSIVWGTAETSDSIVWGTSVNFD